MTYDEMLAKNKIPASMSRTEYDNLVAQQSQQIQPAQGMQHTGLMDSFRDPWSGQPVATSDVRIIDRFLTVKGMPEIEDHQDTPFIFSPELIEQLEQLTLTERSYKEVNRRISDILAISQGELNGEWARVEALKLVGRMLSTKSRIDIPVKNPNLTVLLNTLTSRSDQTVRYKEGGEGSTKPGILDRVIPWRRNR